ncbi:MAG: hypothetical protein JWM80_281 [Cyanobacteria bacterium RYN_339]|nr:hypothetical protein [Cyanobacteria bacterium RYN_339]
MTGFLAVAGFWGFMIIALVRFTARRGAALPPPAEIEQLRSRVQQLEHQLSTLHTQVLELHEGHDFTLKLLKEPPKSAD